MRRFRLRLMACLSLVSTCVLAAALLTAAPARTASADPRPAPAAKPKIARAVLDRFAAGATSDLWVRLAAGTDLSGPAKIKNRKARGNAVVDDLKATATRTQGPVRTLLRSAGLRSEAFWATNAIYVKGATEAAARKLAAMPEVTEIRASRTYRLPEPAAAKPSNIAPNGLEWGIGNINADDVWAQTGRRGEDVVVASIDTGAQYDHPALVKQYRGNNGDGTFTHDYNWFDTSGTCSSAAPCDKNGHGTHTMGTMAGDDGQGNQIGVAPGVKWIEANGCATCSDVDLLKASQWMLAPTDLSGRNPDVSRRPDIVNNSWGSDVPTDEPLFEDIQEAWAASGIFGVWSNGNSGPDCKTSGTPGSRTLNYSVGAYDSANRIAPFSSRGPGQGGELKPNISAPGVNVRSALPGGAYGLNNGTSMAAPHVAGAIALLWSTRPEYARDIAGTRALLDLSAVDTADAQCGGSATNNNVYGEGRLDALRLVDDAAAGIGTVTGTVTDAGTGEPVAGATITATGQTERTAKTGADGTYDLRTLGGDYTVTTQAFGYRQDSGTVTVIKNGAASRDVTLTPTQRVNVTGKVTDGSGHGWGLAAKVTADDGAGHTWSADTDAGTGAYTLPLLPNLGYTLTYTATEKGYTPAARQLTLDDTGSTVDVALTVTPLCEARGYQVDRDGVTNTFPSTNRPKGWTVTNENPRFPGYDHKPGWVFNNPGGRTNSTGGDGDFAIVDSLRSGAGHVQDTYLTSPQIDMTGREHATLEFGNDLSPATNSVAAVDLSLDGGTTWANVWINKGYPGIPGPAPQVVAIPQATGKANVKFRFHYRGQNSGWWAVDNAFIGDRTCTPIAG
ncbi:S8 family serine peptidase [Actinomadura xylanilytica]|nr:S8 family serine peptidase [Actinomadura xylanilytica]